MKRNKLIAYLFFIGTVFFTINSCSEDKFDEIDTDPNNPYDVRIKDIMPQVTVEVPFNIAGTDLAWYSALFVEHIAGVHSQMRSVDRRLNITSSLGANGWLFTYSEVLKDLQTIIDKGSTGGTEEGEWYYVGIAQVLFAYTMGQTTDLWGKVPYSQALKGADIRQPKLDKQQDIYNDLQNLLDSAIANFEKTPVTTNVKGDLLLNGDITIWKKTAWALKARFYNHLSKTDPQGSADKVLECLSNSKSFTSPTEGLIFTNFESTATGQHPWAQEAANRNHFAASKTVYDLFNSLGASGDPRKKYISGNFPALNGDAVIDQSGTIYSKISNDLISANASMPLITAAEVFFLEAEARLRKNNNVADYQCFNAYQNGVFAALTLAQIPTADLFAYLFDPSVLVSIDKLRLENIITQKYLSFWPFQSIEAYNDWRRTGYPKLKNPFGDPPRRFPYPQTEIATNKNMSDNTTSIYSNGVWWDDGSDD